VMRVLVHEGSIPSINTRNKTMTAATLTRVGQINQGGDAEALFLKLFSGEVLTSFNLANVFSNKHRVHSISAGKSYQFPAIGTATAGYHTPGAEIVGRNSVYQAERVITIDDVLLAHEYIAEIDQLKLHYDVRGEYAKQMGEAIADQFDRNVARNLILAARAATTVTGGNGGGSATQANFGTDAALLAAGIYTMAQTFDEKGLPENERYVAVKPAQYYMMVQKTDLINKDWGGSGAYATGQMGTVAGVTIVKSNKVPQANDTANSAIPAGYRANYSTTVAVGWHPHAVGTVKLMDVRSEAVWDVRRQATLLLAKNAVGHGILRPECAFEFKTS
jgi:hypothetical protein